MCKAKNKRTYSDFPRLRHGSLGASLVCGTDTKNRVRANY